MPITNLTSENFKDTVSNSDVVVVDFWAAWCGPCRQFSPVYEKVSEDFPGVTFGKVNIEDGKCSSLVGAFQIQAIPTLAVIIKGELVLSEAGAVSENELKKIIESAEAAAAKS